MCAIQRNMVYLTQYGLLNTIWFIQHNVNVLKPPYAGTKKYKYTQTGPIVTG